MTPDEKTLLVAEAFQRGRRKAIGEQIVTSWENLSPQSRDTYFRVAVHAQQWLAEKGLHVSQHTDDEVFALALKLADAEKRAHEAVQEADRLRRQLSIAGSALSAVTATTTTSSFGYGQAPWYRSR